MATTGIATQAAMANTTLHIAQNTPPSLAGILSNDPPRCTVCSNAPTSSPFLPGDPSGAISWLPRKHEIPSNSCAHQQAVLNDGAFQHPCLIAMISVCGNMVFCMPITSFGNGTIQGKYAPCHNPQRKERIFNEYVALRNRETIPHNLLGELDYTGQRMDKQSYVHLDLGYWVEWYNIGGKGIHHLTAESLQRVRQLYANAEIDRRQFGSMSAERIARSASKSPPPSRPNTPRSRGCNPLEGTSWKCNAPVLPPSPTRTPFDTMSWRCNAPISPPPSPTHIPYPAASTSCSAPAWRRDAPIFGPTDTNGAPSFITPRRGNAAIPIMPPSPPVERRALNGNWRR